MKKAVIPVAGLGTRLLPTTKEMPKEMLPIFLAERGRLVVKPILHAIFEQLYEVGIRDFYFIVGRGKRAVEDYFTPDEGFLKLLEDRGKYREVELLKDFYRKIENSNIVFINQPSPRGFGDAVLRAHHSIKETFLVHAGDTYIISKEESLLKRIIELKGELNAEVVLLVHRVEDPKNYGVVEVKKIKGNIYRVIRAVEKPKIPPTDLAIVPVYVFEPTIFDALRAVGNGIGQELQLTDGIQKLIEWGKGVYAVELEEGEIVLDIGTPLTYWEALKILFEHFSRNAHNRH